MKWLKAAVHASLPEGLTLTERTDTLDRIWSRITESHEEDRAELRGKIKTLQERYMKLGTGELLKEVLALLPKPKVTANMDAPIGSEARKLAQHERNIEAARMVDRAARSTPKMHTRACKHANDWSCGMNINSPDTREGQQRVIKPLIRGLLPWEVGSRKPIVPMFRHSDSDKLYQDLRLEGRRKGEV